jgi:Predicted esterase
MTYSLNSVILEPLSKEKPKNAVILCHGYGGDGKDISILASYWKAHLTETIFICPDAPEKCAASPSGFQWFDLLDQTNEQILSKSLVAEIKLNKFIDEVKEKNNLSANQIAIVGFSQGCMISLQTGIKRKDKINSIIGYSGKIINTDHLGKKYYI